MKLVSSVFKNNGLIPPKYTCDGDDISPPLEISEVPAQAKSLALICDDPDAPAGNWIHWVIWNIDPETTEIMENSAPAKGIEGITSFGKAGWGGPCPPGGTHRYIFYLYALDTVLDLSKKTDAAGLKTAMAGQILAQLELTGLYSRK
ncbi:MAG: phosphatidylethanolamine-binding protein [Candidatus Buchananbacteria bacterium RIFCSPHIGHO2_01_FULL_46_12]|uniref:Phosphatidylethanolamine-binding protein n=1 Tax=Candidatus Buchananbacteria bacterium RIFCSPHIGHO2_01_FULL_46_12 TaxID=1797536 RepID=A0A1G1Y1U6_9BACT|nr:MAG: phosphatidylethanolamine-binding protein [Candidatus Buchananbacteria bacterium RIFCSPHIGHO2_01_FULL_46_12]